jgi:hypothetical protein
MTRDEALYAALEDFYDVRDELLRITDLEPSQ